MSGPTPSDFADLPRGVSIVLMHRDSFAVSQRIGKTGELGLWQFAGGHVEPREDTLDAARRELLEETGLDLARNRFELIGVAGPLVGYKGEKYLGFRYGVRLYDNERPQRTEPEKATEWRWVHPLWILNQDMLQAVKEFALAFAYRDMAERLTASESNLARVSNQKSST